MSEMPPTLRPVPGVLTGERVVVRPLTDADAGPLHEAVQESAEHLRPWMPWWNRHPTVDVTLDYIRRCEAQYILREGFHMGMFENEGSILGGIGLHVHNWDVPFFEVGYWIRSSAGGRGYVTEAVKLLVTCAFDGMGAQRVQLRCDERNVRSANVARRVGFVHEGTFKNYARTTDGSLETALIFGMTMEVYEQARARWVQGTE